MNAANPKVPCELDSFKFDLQGFAIFRGFMTADEVSKMNELLEPLCERQKDSVKFDFVTGHPLFLEWMADARVLSICDAWMGSFFRFAGAWGIHGRPQNRNLHAGPHSGHGLNRYDWAGGKPVCSCLVFGLTLEGQREDEGGLVFLPGSHKLARGVEGDHVFRKLFGSQLDYSCVVQPRLDPGDLVVFAEATIHGTECWKPKDRVRRMIYFKYAHSCCSYLPESDPQLCKLRQMAGTEQQRRLLDGPWVRTAGGYEAKNARLRAATIVADNG